MQKFASGSFFVPHSEHFFAAGTYAGLSFVFVGSGLFQVTSTFGFGLVISGCVSLGLCLARRRALHLRRVERLDHHASIRDLCGRRVEGRSVRASPSFSSSRPGRAVIGASPRARGRSWIRRLRTRCSTRLRRCSASSSRTSQEPFGFGAVLRDEQGVVVLADLADAPLELEVLQRAETRPFASLLFGAGRGERVGVRAFGQLRLAEQRCGRSTRTGKSP